MGDFKVIAGTTPPAPYMVLHGRPSLNVGTKAPAAKVVLNSFSFLNVGTNPPSFSAAVAGGFPSLNVGTLPPTPKFAGAVTPLLLIICGTKPPTPSLHLYADAGY